MKTMYLAGFPQNKTEAYLGLSFASVQNLKWCSPYDFFSKVMSDSDSSDLFLWLFEPPWRLLELAGTTEVELELVRWNQYQESALKCRQMAGAAYIMANAAGISATELAKDLNFILPTTLTNLPKSDSNQNAFVELFAILAPQQWRLFSEIEQYAHRPKSRNYVRISRTPMPPEVILAEVARELRKPSFTGSDRVKSTHTESTKQLTAPADNQAPSAENSMSPAVSLTQLLTVQSQVEDLTLRNASLRKAAELAENTMQRAIELIEDES